MRILNVVFDDRFGGPQSRIVQTAQTLRDQDVETVLCLPKGEGDAAEIAQRAGVEVRRVGFERIPRLSNLIRILRWTALSPRDVLRFVSLLRKERPKIVHVNGAFFIVPVLASKLMRVPVVWHLNDTIVPPKLAYIMGTLVRLLADRIIVASEAVARHYQINGKYEVIHAPVDIALYRPATRFSKNGGVRRVGLVANWSPVKGVEYFVHGAALVREGITQRKGPLDIEFVFVGKKYVTHDKYCKEIDALIDRLQLRPFIRDYGFVSPIVDVIGELDVLVLSSTSEASPMIVLEAMASGIPVVATDVGGVREMILADPPNPAGIVVPPKNPKAIASGIIELLEHPDKANWMAQNGRRLATELFSLERCAQQHLMVYASLAPVQEQERSRTAGRQSNDKNH